MPQSRHRLRTRCDREFLSDRRAELQGAREITASDAALGGQALRRDRGRTAPRRGLTAAPVEPLTPLRYPDHRHAGAAHDENGHHRCTDKGRRTAATNSDLQHQNVKQDATDNGDHAQADRRGRDPGRAQ